MQKTYKRMGNNKVSYWTEMSDNQQDLVDILEPLNIEARYPSYKERLIQSLTNEKCVKLIEQTKELQQWIKNKL